MASFLLNALNVASLKIINNTFNPPVVVNYHGRIFVAIRSMRSFIIGVVNSHFASAKYIEAVRLYRARKPHIDGRKPNIDSK